MIKMWLTLDDGCTKRRKEIALANLIESSHKQADQELKNVTGELLEYCSIVPKEKKIRLDDFKVIFNNNF